MTRQTHALLHAAEGHLFEHAVIEAADDLGLPVHVVDPKAIRVPSAVEKLRAGIGAPWQKDHKWAKLLRSRRSDQPDPAISPPVADEVSLNA